ncbi:MAG: hypothetical protein AABP62_03110 [Planctomycetota bacterium]
MLLEGRPTGLLTSNVELRLNGRSVGVVRARWFSEGMDLELGGHPVRFEKPSWLRSHFVLKDAEGNELGSATLKGFFGLGWAMNLKSGEGSLERAGWFTTGYVLKQGSSITARVHVTGWFTREWQVVADDSLAAEDVLLIGLVYTTIRHRESRRHHQHSG